MTSDRKLYVVSSDEPPREDDQKLREAVYERARRRRRLNLAYGLIPTLILLLFLWIGYRQIDQSQSDAQSLAQEQDAIVAELPSVEPESTLTTPQRVQLIVTDRRAIDETLGLASSADRSAVDEVRALVNERAEIEQTMRSTDVSGETLSERVASLANQYNAITGPGSQTDEDPAKLLEERDRLQSELEKEREKSNTLESRLTETESQLASAQSQIYELKRALAGDAELVEEIERRKVTEASLRKLLAQTQKQLDRYKAQADEASRQLEDWERRYDKQSDELRSVRGVIKDKETMIGDLERNKLDLQAELDKLRAVSSSIEQLDDKHFVVYFGYNNADITPTVRNGLAAVVDTSKQLGISNIRLVGYTDRRGDAAYNRRLAQRRIASVEGPLRAKLDSSHLSRITIEIDPRGESDVPVSTSDGVEEERNRRVEIILE